MKIFAVLVSLFFIQANIELSGQWSGNVSNQFDIQVSLKSINDRVTATVSSQIGEAIFENGRMSGDSLTFTDVSFNGLTLSSLKGKVKHDTLRFVVNFQGQNMHGTLVRVR